MKKSWFWIILGLLLGSAVYYNRKKLFGPKQPATPTPTNGYGAALNAVTGSALKYLTPRTDPQGTRPLVGGGGKTSGAGGSTAGANVDLTEVGKAVATWLKRTFSSDQVPAGPNQGSSSLGDYENAKKQQASEDRLDSSIAAQDTPENQSNALFFGLTNRSFGLDEDVGAPAFDTAGADAGGDYGTDK